MHCYTFYNCLFLCKIQRACVLKLDMCHINGGVLLSASLYKQQRNVPHGSFSRPASQEKQQKANNKFNLISPTAPKLFKIHDYKLQVAGCMLQVTSCSQSLVPNFPQVGGSSSHHPQVLGSSSHHPQVLGSTW